MTREIAVLDAPSNLGLRPPEPGHLPGVWRLPRALRAQGLLERLAAQDAGEVRPPEYSPAPDPQTGFRNGSKIAAYSQALSKRVAALVKKGLIPLVLGGDCSILLGNMLALRSIGEYGLCFIDGHQDFAYPRSHEYLGYFAAAGLDLGLVTGHGPDALTNLNGLKPFVREPNVVALGFYDDPADAADYETEAIYRSDIRTMPIGAVRALGAQHTARSALRELERTEVQGFWIHLDVDVLDQTVMPTVDSPNPRGLSYRDLIEILQVLLRSDGLAGMEITILDPELDPQGRCAAEFTAAVVESFRSRSIVK